MNKTAFISITLLSLLLVLNACKKVDNGSYLAVFNCGDKDSTGYPLPGCSTTEDLILNFEDAGKSSVTVAYTDMTTKSHLTIDKDSVEGKIFTSSATPGPGFYDSPFIKGIIEKKWGKTKISGEWHALLSISQGVSGDFLIEEQ